MGDVPPEARLNLVIHHLRLNDVGEAFRLVKDMEPTTPQEYILKVGSAVLTQYAVLTQRTWKRFSGLDKVLRA